MEKKKNIVLVLLIIVVGVMACFGIKMSKEMVELKQQVNNNTNVNQNNNQEQQNNTQPQEQTQEQTPVYPKVDNELSSATKEELLNLVGLTENGHKKEIYDDCKNCTEYGTPFTIDDYFIQLDTKNVDLIINEMPISNIKEMIRVYANSNKMLVDKVYTDDVLSNEYECLMPVGACDGISFDNYKIIAKKTNLNEDGKKYFGKFEYYNNYYLFSTTGGTSGTFKIEDNFDFEKQNNNVILNYNIKGLSIDNSGYNFNKKITYTFKQYADGTYYLHSVKVVNI